MLIGRVTITQPINLKIAYVPISKSVIVKKGVAASVPAVDKDVIVSFPIGK